MDPEGRRKIVLELQEKLMNDLPLIPLYVPFNVEGIRTDRFDGWVKTLGGVGNSWTLCTLRPINN
jgi:ABC-type transport system substrate-binding protein